MSCSKSYSTPSTRTILLAVSSCTVVTFWLGRDFEAKRLEPVAKALDYSIRKKIESPKKMGQAGAEGDTGNAAKEGMVTRGRRRWGRLLR